MNIFTTKLAGAEGPSLPVDPIELYQSCSYKDGYGYLRSIQEEVLRNWHKQREKRDIICKMNTGSGKTLTGLLMLYSKQIETKEPSLYLCPNIQLVEQTLEMAELYGIPVCGFDKNRPGDFPKDFINAKKILVCTFHKLFNGKSIFNRDKIKLGAVILDDAHKCVDIAREQCTLTIPRGHLIPDKLFTLFESDLKFQAPGAFHRLAYGDPLMEMKVPYWTWFDNHEKVIEILNKQVTATAADAVKNPDVDSLFFKWNFMTNNLLSYDCYFSGTSMEITPIHVPYHEIASFNEARHRYILSATFEDDYDLIKDIGIDHASIINPIVPTDRKDVGKRLILAPNRFDPKIYDEQLIDFIAQYPKENINTVILVPSNQRAQRWIEKGANYVNTANIDDALAKLSNSVGNFMVFDNRYDGIDLHGDLCRVLVLDGMPRYTALHEEYIENRLDRLRAGRKAQIIEQGLGRGVRSGGDYCVVYLMGDDLMSYLGYNKNMEYFTPITRAQLTLGLQLLDGVEPTDSFKLLKDTAHLCLTKDPDWLKFHTNALSGITADIMDEKKRNRLDISEIERVALREFRLRNYEKAADIILSQIVNSMEITSKEKAWYYQFSAQLMYLGNLPNSNDLQSKACTLTTNMFHPPQGHMYKKIHKKGAQPSLVKSRLETFERPQDIIVHVNDILKQLKYLPEIDAKSFEKKLSELGRFLGFTSQEAERELGNGPDVLWCMSDNHYLILEAKSRSTHTEITRDNVEQLLHSEVWFKGQYGTDMDYTAVTLQSTPKKGRNVNTHDKMQVIDQDCLDLLHDNLSKFATSLQSKHTKGHSEEDLARLLEAYKFTPALFRQTYLRSIKN